MAGLGKLVIYDALKGAKNSSPSGTKNPQKKQKSGPMTDPSSEDKTGRVPDPLRRIWCSETLFLFSHGNPGLGVLET